MKLLNLLLYFFIISILTPSVEAEMIPCPSGKEEMRRDGPRVNIKVTSDQNQTYTFGGTIPAGASIQSPGDPKTNTVPYLHLLCFYKSSKGVIVFSTHSPLNF